MRLLESIAETWPSCRWRSTRLLLAVSGGADSMAMLRAFHCLQPNADLIAVAHFNHGWRGAESDQDAEFVKQATGTLGVPFHLGMPIEGQEANSASQSEEAARELRYSFLVKTAYSIGARYVVTAHTVDDRIETLLHNLFRGTGLAGMSSLRNSRPLDEDLVLVRPMLRVSREEVLEYLQHEGQGYREDSSNQDSSYRRNFLRNEVLPLLRTQYGDAVNRQLLQFSETAGEMNEMLDSLARDYWSQVEEMRVRQVRVGDSKDLGISFPTRSLLKVDWPILQRALLARWSEVGWPLGPMNRSAWNRIRSLHEIEAQVAGTGEDAKQITSQQLPGNLHLNARQGWVSIHD